MPVTVPITTGYVKVYLFWASFFFQLKSSIEKKKLSLIFVKRSLIKSCDFGALRSLKNRFFWDKIGMITGPGSTTQQLADLLRLTLLLILCLVLIHIIML